MVYKQVSAKAVLGKFYSRFRVAEAGWEISALEWIGEVLDRLGNVCMFENRAKTVEILNHRGTLPCDLYALQAVEYEGMHLPYGLDVLIADRSTAAVTPDNEVIDTASVILRTDVDGSLTDQSTGYFKEVRKVRSFPQTAHSYQINPNYILTTFESGFVKLHYLGFALDKDGFPMIPDNPYVHEAMMWFILMNLIAGGYQHPIFGYEASEARYLDNFVRAQNDMMMPSPDKFASIKNSWLRMVPNMSMETQFFLNNERGF